MGFVHAVAMAVWLGGVVLLARVVLAGPGEEDLVQAVRGFGRISTTAIVATIVSGLVQLFRLDGGSLFSDAHGRVLLLKTVLVALMLFVGLTARQVAQARLARAHDLSTVTADRLRRAFGTEAVIGIVVLGLSGWMLSFTPPKEPASDEVDYAVVEPFVDPTSGLDLTVSVNPSRVGLNQLRVELRGPTTGDVTGLIVRFVPPAGSNQGIIEQPIPLTRPGVAVSPSEYLPFSVAGAWTMQVSATTADRQPDRRLAVVRRVDGGRPGGDAGDRPDPERARRHAGADHEHDGGAGAGHDGLTSSSNGTGAATSSCS